MHPAAGHEDGREGRDGRERTDARQSDVREWSVGREWTTGMKTGKFFHIYSVCKYIRPLHVTFWYHKWCVCLCPLAHTDKSSEDYWGFFFTGQEKNCSLCHFKHALKLSKKTHLGIQSRRANIRLHLVHADTSGHVHIVKEKTANMKRCQRLHSQCEAPYGKSCHVFKRNDKQRILKACVPAASVAHWTRSSASYL